MVRAGKGGGGRVRAGLIPFVTAPAFHVFLTLFEQGILDPDPHTVRSS